MRCVLFAGAISILLIVGGARAQSAARPHVRELSRSGNTVTLEITLPAPVFDTVKHLLSIRPVAGQLANGDPLAPIVIPLRVSREASVTVLSHNDVTVSSLRLALTPSLTSDVADNGRSGPFALHSKTSSAVHRGIGYAALTFMGTMRASDISKLELGILDAAGTNAIRAAKTIILRITDPAGLSSRAVADINEPFKVPTAMFRSRLASRGKGNSQTMSVGDAQQLPGIQSGDGNVYRMVVRQSGIYHITYDDITSYGLDPSHIDPTTLRIVNKGQQIAVYVFDRQNGVFGPGDYFEFYGQEERYPGPGTYGDCYYDPDTRDNVYYLVWGSQYSPIPAGGVKRMVEESGEIRTANRSIYPQDSAYVDLRDSSYATTIHFEQDLVNDPLNVSDLDERSDLRDHNFMAILSTGNVGPATATFHTVVPYPDVRANRPVSFRVALHGISNFVPGATDAKGIELPNVPDEDDCMVSVNGQFVLHGVWSGQTMKFLSTDTASQRVSNLPSSVLLGVTDSLGGIQPIAITFAQQKQTTVPACRFAVNWIEIGYSRLYNAYQDSITFRAPKYSTAGLYQFTLQNFSQTDISIYRKGVSKITNVVFSSNPNQARSTSAIFQVNITSASDEFIAIADSLKLKPYKFLKDDFAGLRSPNNSGQYLIITDSEHLSKGHQGAREPVQDLADLRANTYHVTTKIVDVANIYDEFNFGSRSPNAIKAFLSYAYHEWQDPPKYVLLVGVTHMGTNDNSPNVPNDQVPTPYIQAYLEGEVAADAWYSMVDGDDLIPDLIVSRLPTADVAGDAAYVAKVREFEADRTTPGDWKGRAFFIGAGGGFDVDIDGILDRAVPHHVGIERMSTVLGSPYNGTDQTVVNNVNNGIGLMAYFGHGGTAIWDDPLDSVGRAVLTNYDMPRFHNQGRYPFILSMTCFTATYDGSFEGILNSFAEQPSAGSIGGMGTTSYGWEQNDDRLAAAIVPHLYDSTDESFADRVVDGKIDYLLEGLSGDLIPPTLVYCYHIIGDPMLHPLLATDRATLMVASRVIQPGGTVPLQGTSTLAQGVARIELADDVRSPLNPPHIVDNIPVANGLYSFTDNIPNTAVPQGTYRVEVYDKSSNRFAEAAEDVTITNSRITELDFEPRPLPVGATLDFSAAVQSPQPISGVTANITVYSQSANGTVTVKTLPSLSMAPLSDRYDVKLPGSTFQAGDKIVASVTLLSGSSTVTSDSINIIVGAASDPSVWKDPYHRTLTGKFVSTKSGLAWMEHLYNWGASPISTVTASLVDLYSGTPKSIGSTIVSSIPSHGDTLVTIPLAIASIDSALLVFAVSPDAGTSPLNLRDSSTLNDTTVPIGFPLGAASYQSSVGTTIDGVTPAQVHFNNDEVIFSLPAGAEANVPADVIRLNRIYTPAVNVQPDIHFLPMYSDKGRVYTGLRITSDSLGAIPLAASQTGASTLSVKLNLADSLINLHRNDSIFIYRQDDRTKLWTILSTTRSPTGVLTAAITNLGTFGVAYNTDTKPPLVDISVEGQVFTNNGEVPPQPHIHAVIQDANGIDVTPGKTIVKIDNRTLGASEYTMLDSSRTATTINLAMNPSLSAGTHAIVIQATDDNGKTNAPPKELDVHVSSDFSVGVLGSYPNPFTRDYMFIAYEIRGIAFAQSVSLDLYTVSGRRIRTMSYPSNDPTRTFGFLKGGTGDPTSLGYHEVWWDGRDDGGAEVANGVYYYRLTVTTPTATRDIKGKFARVR